MTWSEALPNFLIGLREGLEAGLVVSILLAAVRKSAPEGEGERSTTPIWLGVLGAVMLAGSFAAVLTHSTDVLSSSAQQAVGGILSVLAVGLVTGMVFWMRRSAAGLSRQLRGEVSRAVALGVGALALTAFLAVSREGLETTLFLWAAVKASGSTVAPLAGAGLGLATAFILCWLFVRQTVRINLGVFFNRTALLLIVIAAGVLAYGLGDLQEAGLLPGQNWVAFDLGSRIDANSWWASIVSGITELSPRMTVLQVVAWVAYLGVVVAMFVAAGRQAVPVPATAKPDHAPTTAVQHAAAASVARSRFARFTSRRPWALPAALVIAPLVVAGIVIAALPSPSSADATTVSVTTGGCADGWSAARPGTQTFHVRNASTKAGEIRLVNSAGGIVAEIETLGPATEADMSATLGTGSYTFTCLMSGAPALASATVQVAGHGVDATTAVIPVTLAELTRPNLTYQSYARSTLATLAGQVDVITADLGRDDLAAARTDWLAAQLDWERVGASYDSFGDAGVAVGGLPDGLPGGVHDQGFTGLHRLEYGLWHHQSAADLIPVARTLATDVATVRQNVTSDDIAGDPTNLALRAHEVLEDALRDHLSGLDNQGSDAAYPMTYADAQVTRTILGELSPLLVERAPTLVATAERQLDTLQKALLATRAHDSWLAPAQLSLAQRQSVNGAVGSVLETLDAVPDLLEVPPTP